jgi:4a-hydroxytetrahydrobiopterin dehydratase
MDWKIENGVLTKEYEFKDFLEAVEFVNKISILAETINHHPDLLIHSYNKVKIMLSSHEENKVTDKDYALANRIDELIL